MSPLLIVDMTVKEIGYSLVHIPMQSYPGKMQGQSIQSHCILFSSGSDWCQVIWDEKSRALHHRHHGQLSLPDLHPRH